MEKAMAPHSSTLAWKIPWMEEPGGLQSMGSLRVGHDWSDLAVVVVLLRRKVMTNLDSILESRDITFPTKVQLAKAGFSSGHVWMWKLEYKESWVLKSWCFWTVVLEKTLESPLNCKEIQAVHPKGDQSWVFIGRTDVEAETPILWPCHAKSWLIGKDPDAGKDWEQEEKGMTEDETVWWHHRLNGHGFGWTPRVGDGQGGLACCGSRDHRVLDTTERLNWTEKTLHMLPCTIQLVLVIYWFFYTVVCIS